MNNDYDYQQHCSDADPEEHFWLDAMFGISSLVLTFVLSTAALTAAVLWIN